MTYRQASGPSLRANVGLNEKFRTRFLVIFMAGQPIKAVPFEQTAVQKPMDGAGDLSHVRKCKMEQIHNRWPMNGPVRCHLLIGPPASGKTTLAQKLAPLLTKPGEQPALVLSTDRIRLRCLVMVGSRPLVRHPRTVAERAAGGTRRATRDPRRHSCTPALAVSVHPAWNCRHRWVDRWWLQTPTAQCLAWNQT